MNDQSWYRFHQLVHYTRDPETVSSILENGFLLVPNGRGAHIQLQYHSHDREFIAMKMPFLEAARLHGYLHAAMRDPKLASLVDLALGILHGPHRG